MTDQPSAANPMNAAAIPMNRDRVSASTPINAAPPQAVGGGAGK